MMRLLLLIMLLYVLPASAEQDEGQQLFESYCVLCHQLPDPDMLNMRQWQRVIQTMQVRMQSAEMEPLTEQQVAEIMKYLQWQQEQ